MQDIQAWLQSGCDYVQGINLLEKYGGSPFYIKLFRVQGPTPFNIKELRAEIDKLNLEPITQPAAPVLDSPNRTNFVQKKVSNDDQLTYLRLLKQRDETYRQLDHNNAALDLSTNQDVLFITALKLKSLWFKLQEIWAKLDFYKEHGCFPEDEPVKEVITPEIQRLYVSINKAEKRLLKPDCRNRFKTEALLKLKRERLQQLKDNG